MVGRKEIWENGNNEKRRMMTRERM